MRTNKQHIFLTPYLAVIATNITDKLLADIYERQCKLRNTEVLKSLKLRGTEAIY